MYGTSRAATYGASTAQPIRDDGIYVARHGFGYSRFEHEANGIALDLLHLVPLDDPIQISRLKLTQPRRTGRASSRSPPMRSGCWAPRAEPPLRSSLRSSTSRAARCWRAIAGAPPSAPASPSPALARGGRPRGPRTAPNSSAVTADPSRRLASQEGAAVRPDRRRPRSVRRPTDGGRARHRRERRGRLVHRPMRVGGGGTGTHRPLPPSRPRCRPRLGDGPLGRGARHRPGEDAGPGDGHHAERLAAVSDARLPHHARARPSIRRAAPMASATSCRTAWR